MYDHTLFLCLQLTRSAIQAIRKVGCQPGDCKWSLHLPQGFKWVYHTHFKSPRGDIQGLKSKEGGGRECTAWARL